VLPRDLNVGPRCSYSAPLHHHSLRLCKPLFACAKWTDDDAKILGAVIPYGISLVTLGYPLFVLETSLGQGTGKSPIGALSVRRACHSITFCSRSTPRMLALAIQNIAFLVQLTYLHALIFTHAVCASLGTRNYYIEVQRLKLMLCAYCRSCAPA
jgi:hypothetical protein